MDLLVVRVDRVHRAAEALQGAGEPAGHRGAVGGSDDDAHRPRVQQSVHSGHRQRNSGLCFSRKECMASAESTVDCTTAMCEEIKSNLVGAGLIAGDALFSTSRIFESK